ncbi:MAG: class I SAM-dependent methyltransferase [Alphaproteobacteria bacterium]|nr:class I SAM-dependent methyltransferase [Alphaproteobacteria bacterium]
MDARRHAPATLRNRDPILAVLRRRLPPRGLVLEVASGSGEHAAHFAPRLAADLVWTPSDADPSALASIDAHAAAASAEAPGGARIAPALLLDAAAQDWPIARAEAIFCANMIHIAPWAAAAGLLAGAGRVLTPGAPLILYGPFQRAGLHTAPSNEAFDESLRLRDSAWGVRDLEEEVLPAAETAGLALDSVEEMPANNLCVVLRRR